MDAEAETAADLRRIGADNPRAWVAIVGYLVLLVVALLEPPVLDVTTWTGGAIGGFAWIGLTSFAWSRLEPETTVGRLVTFLAHVGPGYVVGDTLYGLWWTALIVGVAGALPLALLFSLAFGRIRPKPAADTPETPDGA